MNASTQINCDLTPSGRLLNLADWNRDVAKCIANNEGLTLTEAHWEIILLMREYYQTYNIPPILKLLKREIEEKLGAQKADNAYLEKLFPGGAIAQGTKIAGLPVPMLDAEIEVSITPRAKPVVTITKAVTSAHQHFTKSFEFQGKTYQVHEKGNLVNLEDWNEAMAEFLALHEGITLTPNHWEIIRFMRQFYFKYGITPMVRLLVKQLRNELGANKHSDEDLYALFPGGPSRQGSRIAGLPEPQGCID